MIPSSSETAIGELVTCSHPSWMVAFPGTLNPVTVTESPWGSTVEGPFQFAVPAVAIGARIMRSTIAPASLLRSAGMLQRVFRSNITKLVLFYEQTHLARNSHPIYQYLWSHWGELNPRPSPYQGDAIPLSHSGDGFGTYGLDLIATILRGFFINRLKSRMLLVGLEPRSHSPVLRMTGNHVGFSLGSSNLPLGATSQLQALVVSN